MPPGAQPQRSSSLSTTVSSTSLSLVRTNSLPTLETLNLAHILNGETCPPISFPDFAGFITHKEFSTENLLFIIWFRSYRARYEALPEAEKVGIPIPSTRLGDRYDPFGYIEKAMAERANQPESTVDRGDVVFDLPFGTPEKKRKKREPKVIPVPPQHGFTKCEWTKDGKRACECGQHVDHRGSKGLFGFRPPKATHDTPQPILHRSSLYPPLPPIGTTFTDPADQPMRLEAERAFATFLRKGGSRELGVGDDLRQFTRTCLNKSTAPEVFLPMYEEFYHVVESQSLPHFLSYAKTNINRPKQVFWYMVGLTDFMIGLAIYLVLTFVLSNQSFGLRAARLPSALFVSFGSMQAYSAYRGFCTQVWGRSSRQIRPWEMDEVVDEEAEIEGDVERMRPMSKATEFGEPPSSNDEDIYDLPHEVHSLTDLSSMIATPAPTTALAPWKLVSFPGTEDHDNEEDMVLSDKAMRQLQIRRATIAVPDANLVFPIGEETTPDIDTLQSPVSATPFIFNQPFGSPSKDKAEISPFDVDPHSQSSPDPSAGTSSTAPHSPVLKNRLSSTATPSAEPIALMPEPIIPDLTSLLVRFRRSEPKDPEFSTSTKEKDREKRLERFGPEKLIEDPRVKKMHDDVVRDILIVGVAMGVIWIAICLATPIHGM